MAILTYSYSIRVHIMSTAAKSPDHPIADQLSDGSLASRIEEGYQQLAELDSLELTTELDELNRAAFTRVEDVLTAVHFALKSQDAEDVEDAISILAGVQTHGRLVQGTKPDPEFDHYDQADAFDLTYLKTVENNRAEQAAKESKQANDERRLQDRKIGLARQDTAKAERVIADRRVVRVLGEELVELEYLLDARLTELLGLNQAS